jgi:hypothetical protein
MRPLEHGVTSSPESARPSPPAFAPELERGRFSLSSVDARTAGASFTTHAVFDGTVVCMNPPRARVAALLPSELRLAEPTDAGGPGPAATSHPLLFVFGRQRRCAMRVGGIDVERDIAYREMMLLVPFVTPRRLRQLSIYVPAMVSSYYLANWTGEVHYGFGKRPAHILDRPPLYAVTLPDRGLAFRAIAGGAGRWSRSEAAGAAPMLERLAAIAALPWLGRRPGGELVRSWSDWRFSGARVRRIEARCSVHVPLAEGLPPGEYAVPGDDALEIRGMQWWITWPRPCPT